jgi:hypothetical protein
MIAPGKIYLNNAMLLQSYAKLDAHHKTGPRSGGNIRGAQYETLRKARAQPDHTIMFLVRITKERSSVDGPASG